MAWFSVGYPAQTPIQASTSTSASTSGYSRKCNFWKWEENYINVIRAKWPRLFTIPSREDRKFHRIIIALLALNLLAVLFVCCRVA
uniref:Uncharacterized protein n=1 Tax=Aegilops tauschii TaxID=37682 RepID=M8B978_AEGTA